MEHVTIFQSDFSTSKVVLLINFKTETCWQRLRIHILVALP